MTTYTATTTAQLLKYVGTAVNGDTIKLAPGTYSAVTVANINKTGNVTITSADADRPAVLTDLAVKNSSGLTFNGLELSGSKDMPFQVLSSSRIVLDKLDVHGTLNGSSSDDYRGMLVRDSSNVTVSNSHFHELTSALSHLNSADIAFTGNRFDLIRDDGIAGGGSSFVTISNNSFTDFDHVGDVHPDAIQFWTANTTAATTDITISGNTFQRGSGSAVQGIFLGNETGNPYKNLTVTNNTVVGAMYNGIMIGAAANATVTGNVVIGADDQQSWLALRGVASATVADNIATTFSYTSSDVKGAGNVQASAISVADLARLAMPTSGSAVSLAAKLPGGAAKVSNPALPTGVSLLGFIDGASTTGHTYSFVEQRVLGTSGNDVLRASGIGESHLWGYDGNDSLVGSRTGTASTLEGGRGDDIYTIYQANDVVVEKAGEGTDTVYAYASYTLGANVESGRAMAGGLTLTGNNDANSLVAHTDGSVLYGLGGDDFIQGAAGNDRLFGGDGNDKFYAGAGDDYVEGGAGNDLIYGGDGNDILLGGEGTDTIMGDAGVDTMTGGKGADTFVFRGGDCNAGPAANRDVITDFNAAEGDRIALNMIDAKTATAADDAFSFIGNQAFHGVAGELRFAMDGDGITVWGDTNGDKIADIAIHLTGVTTITSSAFAL